MHLSKIISKIRYSKSCITYTTIETLLYQPVRFILTFKVIEIWFLLEGSIANMTCIIIYFSCTLFNIAFKPFIDGKDYCTKCL